MLWYTQVTLMLSAWITAGQTTCKNKNKKINKEMSLMLATSILCVVSNT